MKEDTDRIEALETAARALIAAWDEDEIGQVDGALIDPLRELVKPAVAEGLSETAGKPVFPPNQLFTEGAVRMETKEVSRPPNFHDLCATEIDSLMSNHLGWILSYTDSLDATQRYREHIKTVGDAITWATYLFYIMEPNCSLWEAACTDRMQSRMYLMSHVIDASAAARTEAFGHLRGLWVSEKIEKWELKYPKDHQ